MGDIEGDARRLDWGSYICGAQRGSHIVAFGNKFLLHGATLVFDFRF